MLRVGLTGSIAVGKSYVSGVFAELGCAVIDADVVARRVVEPHSEGLRRVVATFGDEVLRPDGALDRPALGAIVFRDAEKRRQLNAILHPLIIAAQDELLRRAEETDPHGIAVVDAALMIESGSYRRFAQLIVVWCRPEVQLARLMNREGLTREEAERRISAQMPQEEKKSFADLTIDTSEGYESARQRSVEVHHTLLALRDQAET